jgi:hypothetical protein
MRERKKRGEREWIGRYANDSHTSNTVSFTTFAPKEQGLFSLGSEQVQFQDKMTVGSTALRKQSESRNPDARNLSAGSLD